MVGAVITGWSRDAFREARVLTGAPAIGADQKDRDESSTQVLRDGIQGQMMSRPGGYSTFQLTSEELVIALQCTDDQPVEWEPAQLGGVFATQ
jgi:hypothetical protein